MDRIIFKESFVQCTQDYAFQCFTQNYHLEKWLTLKADVEPKEGGKFELFWDLENPDKDSTQGCRILAYKSPIILNFEWKGPSSYDELMNNRRPLTNVSVTFSRVFDLTHIILVHSGWGEGENWDEARTFFDNAWQESFAKLEKYVNHVYA